MQPNQKHPEGVRNNPCVFMCGIFGGFKIELDGKASIIVGSVKGGFVDRGHMSAAVHIQHPQSAAHELCAIRKSDIFSM